MKNILVILSIGFLLIGFSSCEQNFSPETPEILSFSYDSLPAVAGVSGTFSIEANGEFAVMWLGTETSDYDAHLASPNIENKGVAVSLEYDKTKGFSTGEKFQRYTDAGTYKVVLIVSNVGDLGELVEQTTEEMTLIVEEAPVVK